MELIASSGRQTAAHRTLIVAEVMNRVVSNFEKNEDYKSLGLTCRSLYEPAMDGLWYELGSLDPLLRCFPADVWEESGDKQLVSGFLTSYMVCH